MSIQAKGIYVPSTFYYYKEGDQCISRTGGYGWTVISGNPFLEFNSNNMRMVAGEYTDAIGVFYHQTAVDLTHIRTLYIDWAGDKAINYDSIRWGVGTSKTNSTINPQKIMGPGVWGRTIHSLDVSAVTGLRYIKWWLHNSDEYGNGDDWVRVYNLYGKTA